MQHLIALAGRQRYTRDLTPRVSYVRENKRAPDSCVAFTGLPCNCVDQFVPVCGQNGRTYPSACIARCVGLQDNQFEFGSCISKDPCNPNPCNKNQR